MLSWKPNFCSKHHPTPLTCQSLPRFEHSIRKIEGHGAVWKFEKWLWNVCHGKMHCERDSLIYKFQLQSWSAASATGAHFKSFFMASDLSTALEKSRGMGRYGSLKNGFGRSVVGKCAVSGTALYINFNYKVEVLQARQAPISKVFLWLRPIFKKTLFLITQQPGGVRRPVKACCNRYYALLQLKFTHGVQLTSWSW